MTDLISEHGQGGGYKAVPTPRSSAIPPPKKTAPPAATPYAGFLTPAQQVAQAAALADASLLPQQQAYKAAAAQDQQIADLQSKDTGGYYTALANILKDAGTRVRGGYDQAAGNDAAFSRGFSDGLTHVQTQMGQQDKSVLGVAAAPQGQYDAAAQATGGAGVTDALYNATGYQPALNLTQQGAAAAAAATALPAAIGGQGGQALTRISLQEQSNQDSINNKIAALSSQLPQLRQQYGSQLASQQNVLADNARADAQYKQAETDRKQTIKDREAQNAITNTIRMITATGVDKNGNLTPKARADLARISGVDPTTGLPTLDAIKANASIAQGWARVQTGQTNSAIAAGRLQQAGLNAAESKRYHNATLKIQKQLAQGLTIKPADLRVLASTAIKIFQTQLTGKPEKITSTGYTPPVPEIPYPDAMSALENYYRLSLPTWTDEQISAQALKTLKAIPRYKIPSGK